MTTLMAKQKLWIGGGLLLLLIATRGQHFDSLVNLGDATLAVFFLTALLFGGWAAFPALILAVGLVDYSAIQFGGVSSWCVTSAYLMLIPTYAAMWAGGLITRRLSCSTTGAIQSALLLATSTVAAFAVSNIGFYLFSGYFDAMAVGEYAGRVAGYLPGYLAYTLLYGGLGLGVTALLSTAETTGETASSAS